MLSPLACFLLKRKNRKKREEIEKRDKEKRKREKERRKKGSEERERTYGTRSSAEKLLDFAIEGKFYLYK
jgi:hypothetical protein